MGDGIAIGHFVTEPSHKIHTPTRASCIRELSAVNMLICHAFVTLCKTLSAALADRLGIERKVHAWVCKCYPMPREFFGSTGMKFEVVSPLFVPIIPIPPTSHPPALTSCNSNP